jgi:hypothetical protein
MENVWIKLWMVLWIVYGRRKNTGAIKESYKRGENSE